MKSIVYRLLAVLLSLLITFSGIIPTAYAQVEEIKAPVGPTNTSVLLRLLHAAEKSQTMKTDLTADKGLSIVPTADE